MYLIIGASGFIGNSLYCHIKQSGKKVLGTYCKDAKDASLLFFDILKDSLIDFCNKHVAGKISTVIICGGNASIDSCKKNETESNELNVWRMQSLVDEVKEMGVKCVFLSSEAVFDGKVGMNKEEDIPDPINVYGKQKLQMEQYIVKNLEDYIVFRISRAVGHTFGERDIFNEFYTKIKAREDIICLKNQSFCLTDLDDIVNGIVKAVEQNLRGIYHLSSANYVSRYQLAKLYAEKIFGRYDHIYEKEYEELSFIDNRAIYSGLNGEKLEKLLKIQYKNLNEILETYVNDYKSKV